MEESAEVPVVRAHDELMLVTLSSIFGDKTGFAYFVTISGVFIRTSPYFCLGAIPAVLIANHG
jgi:hypothetical protein